MKLLYYSPASFGGIADYAHEQANALVEAGADVTLLTTPNYLTGRRERYKILPLLQDLKPETPISNKLLKGTRYVAITLANVKTLARVIRQHQFRQVLLGSYSEYLAPLWARSLKRLARQGIVFGAVVHDPVRDFVLGPLWWHRWSIACGYSFLREAFVHEAIDLDTVRPMPQLRTTVIPFGPYHFPNPKRSSEDVRAELEIPNSAKVMLAFGHIRPGKNLDLVIQALVHHPDVYLVIAGNEQSDQQQLIPKYKDIATNVGIADRCKWMIGYLPDTEVANLFQASDLIVLTYSQEFRSASSVLSAAANYQKPCLASSGEGPLKNTVQKYQLGIWVKPDCVDAIDSGLKAWLSSSSSPDWEKYFQENSWLENANKVLGSLVKTT